MRIGRTHTIIITIITIIITIITSVYHHHHHHHHHHQNWQKRSPDSRLITTHKVPKGGWMG